MKKIFIYSFVSIVIFAVILAFLFPAKTAWSFIDDEMPEISVGNIDGSVWSPQLKQVSYRSKNSSALSGIQINSVQLDTSILALFGGNFSTDFELNDELINSKGHIKANSETVIIDEVAFDASVADILDLVQLPTINGQNIARLLSGYGTIDGQLSTEIAITHKPEFMLLAGHGQIQDTVLDLPIFDYTTRSFVATPIAVGNMKYVLDLNDDQWIRLTLSDNDGELDLAGTIEIALDKRYKLNLSTTSQLPEKLQQTLGVLGRREQGRLFYKWNSRLP